MRIRNVLVLAALAVLVSSCGSSGGSSTPPAPPAPVAPPPPPPEPTFDERLADWAAMDPNPCRARTPGFEAFGGWLKDDGREVGASRVWMRDSGELSDAGSHGARVWKTLTECGVRANEDHFFSNSSNFTNMIHMESGDVIASISSSPPWEDIPFPEPVVWGEYPHLGPGNFDIAYDGNRENGQRILSIRSAGNEGGKRTSHLQRAGFQLGLQEFDRALWIIVGGYIGEGEDRKPADSGLRGGSSICGDANPLCLFAPWAGADNVVGTSVSAPQVAAALDSVWAVWPDMDILDLRNLAFDCAEDMPAPEGETAVTRSYSYKNGRTFTSDTNSTWGHGILSLTCLFTPNGGLQNPVTGNAISGGISGPLAGPVAGASITGVDYTGREFGYGFAYPVARENLALASLTQAAPRGGAAIANLRPVQANSGVYGLTHVRGAYSGRLWQNGAVSVDLTAAAPHGGAGSAIGTAVQWQSGGWTIRSGLAMQPEGVGSLVGSRAFRAPMSVSAAITAAYGKVIGHGLSAHLQADHWRTLATQGRSLWENAVLSESRFSAALVKRFSSHEFALQGVWRSGLSGSLNVSERSWALTPQSESGVWLTWLRRSQ